MSPQPEQLDAAIAAFRAALDELDGKTFRIFVRDAGLGDTEAGLRLKNLLDAVELPRWLTGA